MSKHQATVRNSTISSLLIILGCLFTVPASQSAELVIGPSFERHSLDPTLDYLFDENYELHLGQVAEANSNLPWQAGSTRDHSLLMPAGLYWFKGQLKNPGDQAVDITLQVQDPSIKVADLYLIDASGNTTTLYADTGLSTAFENRPSPHRDLVNTITIAANSSVTLIWRINNAPLFQFEATAWNPEHFNAIEQHQQILYGMIYGILLVMTLYNLFLFVSTREKSYLFYVLFVLSFGYVLAADRGHLYQYVATELAWEKAFVYVIAYIFNLLMFSQFTIYFLNLPKRNRYLVWLIRGLVLLSALFIIGLIIIYSPIMLYLALLAITMMFVVALGAGILVRQAGVISAGHFIIAIMILVFSLIASNMAALGLIKSSPIIDNLTPIGTTVMLIFFSLALADRINQLQKESREANISMAQANSEKLRAQTGLKKAQKERIRLEKSSNQARRENNAKSHFLSTLSSEIGTPMNDVLKATKLIKGADLNPQQSSYIQQIERSSESLLSIISDLQDFAKIEEGKLTLEYSSFNLKSLLDNCIQAYSSQARQKNINFIADIDTNFSPLLRGDPGKLRKIIDNLLDNALKFTDQGEIVLSAHATDKSSVNSIEIKFEIKDTGIGISEEEQQRLFTPFQHADESTYQRYGGHGLGLAISRELAELMNGDIGVISSAGQGSCFWFTARLLYEEIPESMLPLK